MNFITKKQQEESSRQPPDKTDILAKHKPSPKRVKIDIEKMNNTMGESGTGSQLSFPKIMFEDEKRVQGTANFDSSRA